MKKLFAALCLGAASLASTATEVTDFFNVNIDFTPGCSITRAGAASINVGWAAFRGPLSGNSSVAYDIRCSANFAPSAVGLRLLGDPANSTAFNSISVTDTALQLDYTLFANMSTSGSYSDPTGKRLTVDLGETGGNPGQCSAGQTSCSNASSTNKTFYVVVQW